MLVGRFKLCYNLPHQSGENRFFEKHMWKNEECRCLLNVFNNIWAGSFSFYERLVINKAFLFVSYMHKLQSPLMYFSNTEVFYEGEEAIPILDKKTKPQQVRQTWTVHSITDEQISSLQSPALGSKPDIYKENGAQTKKATTKVAGRQGKTSEVQS